MRLGLRTGNLTYLAQKRITLAMAAPSYGGPEPTFQPNENERELMQTE